VSTPAPDSRQHLYGVAFAAMFVFGVVLGLPGTVLGLPEVAAQFGLTLAARGTLIATLFMGILIGSFVSGPIVDRAGQRLALVGATALAALSLPRFAAAWNMELAVAALATLGVASAGINTASNALSSDLFPHERGRRMNGIALAVGLGGSTMPALTALAEGHLSWRVVVIGAAVFAGAVALAGTRVGRIATIPHAAVTSSSAVTLMRQRGFAWFCLLMVLGAANEASMAGWTSTYLNATGFTPVAATWGLSSHWLGLTAGRVIFAARVDRVKRAAIVRAALTGAAAIAVFVSSDTPGVLAVAPFGIGVAISVIMPTSLALAGESCRGNTGALFGVLLTLAQVGSMLLPALVGAIAQRWGLRAGMSLLVVNALMIALVAWRAHGQLPEMRAQRRA
jgi:MFS family permease